MVSMMFHDVAPKKIPKRNLMGLLQFKLQIAEILVADSIANRKILSEDKKVTISFYSKVVKIL